MLAVVRQIVDRLIANLVALVVEPCCGTFDIDIKVLWSEIGLLIVEWQENDAVGLGTLHQTKVAGYHIARFAILIEFLVIDGGLGGIEGSEVFVILYITLVIRLAHSLGQVVNGGDARGEGGKAEFHLVALGSGGELTVTSQADEGIFAVLQTGDVHLVSLVKLFLALDIGVEELAVLVEGIHVDVLDFLGKGIGILHVVGVVEREG